MKQFAHEPSGQELGLFPHGPVVCNQVGHVSAVRSSQLLGNLLHRHFFSFFFSSESEYSCTRKSGFQKEKGNINLEVFGFFLREKRVKLLKSILMLLSTI